MGHDKLGNHFKTQFGMVQHHGWDIKALEEMMPWERYIYVDLLQEFLKDEEQKAKDRENEMKDRARHFNRKRM
jgi:hypothetical protein